MDVTCEVRIDAEDEETAWVRWELRSPTGETVASGRAAYDLETVHFHWEGAPPPREHEGVVRTAIDRAIRRRGG
jgi:hypothetical protein